MRPLGDAFSKHGIVFCLLLSAGRELTIRLQTRSLVLRG
jgi:hypothetical protein